MVDFGLVGWVLFWVGFYEVFRAGWWWREVKSGGGVVRVSVSLVFFEDLDVFMERIGCEDYLGEKYG